MVLKFLAGDMKKEIKEKVIEMILKNYLILGKEPNRDGWYTQKYEIIADQILELFEKEKPQMEKIEDWGKKFNKNFGDIIFRKAEGGFSEKSIKSFIRKLLAQEKQKWIRELSLKDLELEITIKKAEKAGVFRKLKQRIKNK